MGSFPVFDSASFHAPSPKLIKEAGLGPPRRRLASPANVIGGLELMHVPLADDKITKMSLRIYFRSHSPRSHGTHGIRGGLETGAAIKGSLLKAQIFLRRKWAHPNALLPMLMSVPMSVANCRHDSRGEHCGSRYLQEMSATYRSHLSVLCRYIYAIVKGCTVQIMLILWGIYKDRVCQ
jgi:hypothetical protein